MIIALSSFLLLCFAGFTNSPYRNQSPFSLSFSILCFCKSRLYLSLLSWVLSISVVTEFLSVSIHPMIQQQYKSPVKIIDQLQCASQYQFCQYNHMIQKQELQKRKKAKVDAEVAAFTCLLVYFVVKAIVLLILYKYDNLLKHQHIYIPPFALLLILNTYLMLTVGKDPGFQTASFEENQLLQYKRDQNNFCAVCNCRKKNRSKHCYLCGKCVRKYDHHCPWIGACVGQNNHFKFWLLLITHTLQATLTFYILFESMGLYQYKHSDGSFSAQYGAFAIFSFFMLLYIGFTGPLVIFHGYLILMNVTSKELLRRKKCTYLANVRGNPYYAGLFQNLKQAMFVQESGREWLIQTKPDQNNTERSWLAKIWSNDYYSCC